VIVEERYRGDGLQAIPIGAPRSDAVVVVQHRNSDFRHSRPWKANATTAPTPPGPPAGDVRARRDDGRSLLTVNDPRGGNTPTADCRPKNNERMQQ
jgi:hypothetical protein